LEQLLNFSNPHIVAINETWISENISNSLDLSFNNYNVFFCNRNQSKKGGGVLIMVMKSIIANEVYKFNLGFIEILVVDVHIKQKYRIISFYRQPNSTLNDTEKLASIFASYLTKNTLILGDLNIPNFNFINCSNGMQKIFTDFFQTFNVKQIITENTRGKNVLDVCITNVENNYKTNLLPGISDHDLIEIILDIPIHIKSEITFRNYREANYLCIENDLYNIFWNFNQFLTLNEKVNYFTNTFNISINANIPMKKKSEKRLYDKRINAAIKQKLYLYRAYKKSTNIKDKISYLNQCKLVKMLTINWNNSRILKLIKKPKAFHSHIQSKFKKSLYIPDLLYKEKSINDDSEKANCFGKIFEAYFTNKDSEIDLSSFSDNIKIPVPCIDYVHFDIGIIQTMLKNLPDKNNTTPDFIPQKVLKNCSTVLAPILSDLFKTALDIGNHPTIWKQNIIIPIPKSNNHTDPTEYRPITLSSSCSRIMETIISKNLLNHLVKNKLISENQFGFRQNSSVSIKHAQFFEFIYDSLYNKKCIDIIQIDFKKAFDTVQHKLLILKLQWYGIRGKLLCWIKNFLKDREYIVKVNQQFSQTFKIQSGVPQGSPLGPILFLIYINDLPATIGKSIKIGMFADDVTLFTAHQNCEKVIELQNQGINEVKKWAKKWVLEIQTTKTHVMHLGKNNANYQYTLNLEKISQQKVLKDLGITFDSNLCFKLHIDKIIKMAKFRAYQILKTLSTDSFKVLSLAYKTYVRPLLEFSTTSWNPTEKISINKIENVQKWFTRIALKKCKRKYQIYKERLNIFKLTSLETRRLVEDLTLFYKIVKNKTVIPPNKLITFNTRPSRYHDLQVLIKHKSNLTKNSFINRCATMWNKLEANIINSPNARLFKIALNKKFAELD
jgi:hypothetical protein